MSQTVAIVDCFVRSFPEKHDGDVIKHSVGSGDWRVRARLQSPTTAQGRGSNPGEAMDALRRALQELFGPADADGTPVGIHLRVVSMYFPKDRGQVEPFGDGDARVH